MFALKAATMLAVAVPCTYMAHEPIKKTVNHAKRYVAKKLHYQPPVRMADYSNVCIPAKVDTALLPLTFQPDAALLPLTFQPDAAQVPAEEIERAARAFIAATPSGPVVGGGGFGSNFQPLVPVTPPTIFEPPVTAVPEVSTWAQMAAGFGVIAYAARRQAKKNPGSIARGTGVS